MAYTTFIVKQGDCISSIAYEHGLFPDTIWNDSKNSQLKQDRKDPNVLMPGDKLYIRDKDQKEESCASEKKHRFRRKGVPEKLVIRFEVQGEPRTNEDYVLDIDGQLSEGTTSSDGMVEIAIPPNARTGKISFRASGEDYYLQLGQLDPVTEISGVQARLRNLGFYEGEIDGKMNEDLGEAIQHFQETQQLEPNGSRDATLEKKLQEAHGG